MVSGAGSCEGHPTCVPGQSRERRDSSVLSALCDPASAPGDGHSLFSNGAGSNSSPPPHSGCPTTEPREPQREPQRCPSPSISHTVGVQSVLAGLSDGWMDGHTGGYMGGWTHGRTH